jgi:HSP20 family molecular chaperone IbpA
MSRVSLFNSPLLLGFERVERLLDTVAKSSSDGYPPYNIERLNDSSLRITLAVAGFTNDTLSVSIEANQLVIRGKQPEENDGREYLHRGIAARQFQRSFVLAEGIEVVGAHLMNGLLEIDLVRPEPSTAVRQVKITSGKPESTKTPVSGQADQVSVARAR